MTTPHTHIEDAEKDQAMADPAKTLTDEQLEEGGLRPVQAFVRTRASKNALRVARSKENKAEQGIKQVNVQAPESIHAALKEIAKRTAAGESLADAVAHAVPEFQKPINQAAVAPTVSPAVAPAVDPAVAPVVDMLQVDDQLAKVVEAVKKPGFKSWLIKKLAGI